MVLSPSPTAGPAPAGLRRRRHPAAGAWPPVRPPGREIRRERGSVRGGSNGFGLQDWSQGEGRVIRERERAN